MRHNQFWLSEKRIVRFDFFLLLKKPNEYKKRPSNNNKKYSRRKGKKGECKNLWPRLSGFTTVCTRQLSVFLVQVKKEGSDSGCFVMVSFQIFTFHFSRGLFRDWYVRTYVHRDLDLVNSILLLYKKGREGQQTSHIVRWFNPISRWQFKCN